MRTSSLRFLLLGLFHVALCAHFGVNIYVSENVTWSEAREYCRKQHTDMSSVSSLEESLKLIILGKMATAAVGSGPLLQSSTGSNTFKSGWIGLYKEVNGTWKWSGGRDALFFEWIPAQKQSKDQNCVVQSEGGWQAVNCEEQFPFFCFQTNLVLVEEKKSWEEAMEHCHSLNKKLVSLQSESALNKALQTSRNASTVHIWTGLRYLGDSWLWVDTTSQAPSQREMLQCPAWTHHCGALSLDGQQMDSWDCADNLNSICY